MNLFMGGFGAAIICGGLVPNQRIFLHPLLPIQLPDQIYVKARNHDGAVE